jgi:Ca2+-binding RTX toxin-like protein
MAIINGTDESETLLGTSDPDTIDGKGGDDTLRGVLGDDTLSDSSGNNRLFGGDGNDLLSGNGGNNAMYGGKGADDYFVDNIQDSVRENGREGTDEVATTLGVYALGPNVEHLRFVGEGHFFGTGTTLNNIIVGGDGNDVLKGGGGNDRLVGAIGLDTAVLSGKSTDYAISTVDGITTVTDLNAADGSDGKDTLNGIELLQFADKTIALPTAPQAEVGLGGFTLLGANYGDDASNAISIGDINGDGLVDLLIGARGFDPDGKTQFPDAFEASAGAAYVVFGEPDNWPLGGANLRDLNKGGEVGEINGFRLEGFRTGQSAAGTVGPGDQAGRAVAAAGDVNGDGFADFIVGAPTATTEFYYEGEAYVVFGKAGSWPTSQDLIDLDGTDGFRIPGTTSGTELASDVSSAGDINGDGLDDVIVSGDGNAYVIFGKSDGWSAGFDITTLNGTNGFTLEGAGAVSDAGDVNGDGIDDMIVSELGGSISHVVYGRLTPWNASYVLADMDGTTEVAGALTAIGDINDDGLIDLAASDPATDPHGILDAGSSFVVFGDDALVGTTVNLAGLNGTNGFRVDSSHLNAGSGPVAAGDVNGDGYQDFMINAGDTYVIYGKAGGWTPSLELAEINGFNGFRIDSNGAIAQSAGDLNKDGFSDLVFAVPSKEPSDPGASVVFFGGNFPGTPIDVGVTKLSGEAGSDTLSGKGGNFIMYGGKGADDYFVDNVLDKVVENGREGTDEVATTLNLYALGPNVERLRFVGEGHFFGTGTTLNNIIVGGDGNDVLKGGGGNDRLVGAIGLDTAVFSGKSTDYAISTVNGITTVTDLNAADGKDGKDTLNGIESLQFADKTIALPSGPQVEMGLGGLTLFGANYGDDASNAVSIGDINGDGFVDLLIGAPGFDPNGFTIFPDAVYASAGAAYVIYGDPANWPISANLRGNTDPDVTGEINGFRLEGVGVGGPAAGTIANGDQAGHSVAAAGDINGDGFADFIVGAPTAYDAIYEAGEAYVVFGKATAFPPVQDLIDLDGTDGFRIPGVGFEQWLGTDVSSAGDINGDGLDDLIVSSSTRFINDERNAYVIFGKAGGWSPSFDLTTLDGKNGFRLEDAGAVSKAGDVNGDGIDDVIVSSHVIYGRLTPWNASYVLADLEDTTTVAGALAAIGDINGDGRVDLAASNQTTDPHGIIDAGSSFVIFGNDALVGTTVDLGSLNGSNGFRVDSSHLDAGSTPVAAGDVNGDGYQDFMINADDTYVIYGKAGGWASGLELAEINGVNGFRIDSNGAIGQSSDDLNGDGFSDLVFAVPAKVSSDPGASVVFFGGNFTNSVEHLGSAGNDTLPGSAAAENFVGGLGNDSLISGGGIDSFRGGGGNDTIVLSSANFLDIDGGLGVDTISLGGAGLTLDLSSGVPGHIRNVERVDITGTGNNVVQLTVSDVLDISDQSNSLLVAGNAGDTASIGPGWTKAASGGTNGNGTSTIDGQVYQHYNAAQASLLVDTDIGVPVT